MSQGVKTKIHLCTMVYSNSEKNEKLFKFFGFNVAVKPNLKKNLNN